MAITYAVTANSCSFPITTITMETINYFQAEANYHVLRLAFRDVSITNAGTGEVIRSEYVGEDFFTPTLTIEQAIAELKRLRLDWLER